MQRAIDAVGVPRSTALVELLVVKAFSEASLDVYQSAGVRRVGLVPETLIASPRDARRVTPTGPAGTRSRRGKGPGLRTIQRIAKQEREIATAAGALVRVRTAGDKKVCKVCRGIAKRGPYRINRARSLIPAHPRCRCVFVPVVTKSPKDGVPVLLSDTIRRLENGKYRLYSGTGRNLGTFETLEAAKKHEREVEFFKHRDEFNPNQPRDPEGKWTSGGAVSANVPSVAGLVRGNSAERVAMRKALKSETDPEKRRALQASILESFQKQIAKKGGDPDLEAKLAKYSRLYKMMPPGLTITVTGVEQKGKAGFIKITSTSLISGKIREAVDQIPKRHQKKLAELGVTIETQDTLHYQDRQSGRKKEAAGLYWSGGPDARKVQIAENGRISGYKLPARNVRGTVIHELGHGLDHANNWEPGSRIAETFDKEFKKLSPSERYVAAYYNSNNREKFAEMYSATYLKSGIAMGMDVRVVREKFPETIAYIKSMEDAL